jgi:hypothetical protein
MHWLNPHLRSTFFALLGHQTLPSDSVLRVGIEEIRTSMLDALGDSSAFEFSHVNRKIRYADDIQTLWYLRGDLMAVLAAKEGESQAQRKIRAISCLFEGLLPRGLTVRTSPLVE